MPGPVLRHVRVLGAGLTAVVLAVAAGGCGASADDERPPDGRVVRVVPPARQALAYASPTEVGVLRDGRTTTLGRIRSGARLLQMQWSGDGNAVGWLAQDEERFTRTVTVADVRTGRSHTFTEESLGSLAPGLRGVTTGSFKGSFAELRADGTRRDFAVDVAPVVSTVVDADADAASPPVVRNTSVSVALPLNGQWLVAAENDSRMGAHGAPHRLFAFDPARGSLTLAGITGYSSDDLVRVSDRAALWIERGSNGACDPYARLGGYGMPVPELPPTPDGSWEIRRAIAAKDGVEVVVRRLRGSFDADGGGACTEDARTLRWMVHRAGAWSTKATGVIDVGAATDGRRAVVRGRITGLRDDQSPLLEVDSATVIDPAGERVDLPSGTTTVLFSPASPMTVADVPARGPGLAQAGRLGGDGLGALRFGATAREVQAGTGTRLRIALDARGCGTIQPQDPREQARIGVVGRMVDGRLDRLEVTSGDRPVDYEHDALSSVQTDVSAIEVRGPATPRGVRAGESVDGLLAAEGTPADTRQLPDGRTRYRFEDAGRTLLADVDGAGVLRRMVWMQDGTPGTCEKAAR